MKRSVHIFSDEARSSFVLYKLTLTLILLLGFQISAWAQSSAPEPVQISLAANTADPVWVGQKVTVRVEVLSETFFAGPTLLSLPDIAGAVFYKPEERALVSSRTIDGQAFSVQMHELSFYPQRAGDFIIPAFKVRFGIAGKPSEAPTERFETTKPLKLSAKMPAGAEHLAVLISATDLKVSESWQPQPSGKLTVGDAFKRTITFRASDMPGMVFPSINFPEIDGIKTYRARATVNDKINRGSLTGERIDVITYLCEKPGSYSLPAVTIPWWNPSSEKMQRITLPAVSFEVEASISVTPLAIETQNPRSPLLWKSIVALTVSILFLIAIFFRYKNSVLHRFTTWQVQRSESEAAYFKKILRATTPAQSHNAINQWFVHSEISQQHNSLSAFAHEQNNETLLQQIEDLNRAIVHDVPQWETSPLNSALKSAREQMRSRKQQNSRPCLKDLNPRR